MFVLDRGEARAEDLEHFRVLLRVGRFTDSGKDDACLKPIMQLHDPHGIVHYLERARTRLSEG